MMYKEGTDYELIPHEDPNDIHWRIRILTGDYTEVVYQYTVLRPDEDGEHLKYNFVIIYTPIDIDESEEGLQKLVGDILYSILNDIANQKEEG